MRPTRTGCWRSCTTTSGCPTSTSTSTCGWRCRSSTWSAPRQAGWAFLDASFRPIPGEHASGAVAHGRNPFGPVSYFGPTPAACELLDGVFIAAQAGRLREAGVRFDPRFRFHFYDIDFCRTARAAGLRVGTWPISLVHQSEGGFDTPDWHATYADYLAKWGD